MINEWSFVSAHADGQIISIDGKAPLKEIKVRDLCTGEGWNIEHASTDAGETYCFWRLILSRPFGHDTDAVARRLDQYIGLSQEATPKPSDTAALVGAVGG